MRSSLVRRVGAAIAVVALTAGLTACIGAGGDSKASGDFCKAAKDALSSAGTSPVGTQSGGSTVIQQYHDAMVKVTPPSAIKDEWQTMADRFQKVADVTKNLPTDMTELDDIEGRMKELGDGLQADSPDTKKYNDAVQKVNTYLVEHCE